MKVKKFTCYATLVDEQNGTVAKKYRFEVRREGLAYTVTVKVGIAKLTQDGEYRVGRQGYAKTVLSKTIDGCQNSYEAAKFFATILNIDDLLEC